MLDFVIVGSGMAGIGAACRLSAAGKTPVIFDKNNFSGGHTASFHHAGGWIFDDGPHISFTKNDRIKQVFSESSGGKIETIEAKINNYWNGYWIKHPVQCNLNSLPRKLSAAILKEFSKLKKNNFCAFDTYEKWLINSYGLTFAQTFPMRYGLKYHTTSACNMTTDWMGSRLYLPEYKEILSGALCSDTSNVHYINEFRYPTYGGFYGFIKGLVDKLDIKLGYELLEINLNSREVCFKNSQPIKFKHLISSIPLPKLIKLIKNVPEAVMHAANMLAWTKAVIVNLGINRSDISEAHWSYFYDYDYLFSRLSFPHMFSANTVPKNCGSIQAEIYFSDKYFPLNKSLKEYKKIVIQDLQRCGLLYPDDTIMFSDVQISPWCQIIFDHDRSKALSVINAYLNNVGIQTCGRYGKWTYFWTDESYLSGETAAEFCLAN